VPEEIYQLKATIVGTKPPVWRRLLVPKAITLFELHEVLQAAFGWWDCHLHEFEIDGARYGTDDGEGWGPSPKSERRARLGRVAKEGTAFRYVYDFGDNWEHKLVVEKVIAAVPGATYPACTAGRRACPPEDCGGVWGYADFLAVIDDPSHPEHDSMLEWVGGAFDPNPFDAGDFAHRLGLGRLAE
jgi:hypothetical protein